MGRRLIMFSLSIIPCQPITKDKSALSSIHKRGDGTTSGRDVTRGNHVGEVIDVREEAGFKNKCMEQKLWIFSMFFNPLASSTVDVWWMGAENR